MDNSNQNMQSITVPAEFAEFMRTYFGDKRGIIFPAANILKEEVPLDNANVGWVQKDWSGDFLYADSDSNGTIYIKINDIAAPKIPIQAGMKIEGFPFKKVFIQSAAQAGKVVNILYGYGARIVPPYQNINTIGSIIAAITAQGPHSLASPPVLADLPLLTRSVGRTYGAAFANAGLTAATPVTVFAPGSNTNGATLHRIISRTNMGALGSLSCLAKTSAPAGVTDGDILMGIQMQTANVPTISYIEDNDIFIAAGKGVYWYSDTTETGGAKSILYTLH